MNSRLSWWNFLAFLLIGMLVAFVTGTVGQMTMDNLACRSTGYDADHFLAYCDSQKYASYEHGAFLYGVEVSAVSNIRNADVLFLGNSKMQAAFSTRAVTQYFSSMNVTFFLMGFGYAEESKYAFAILKRWNIAPKVLVINADPFFSEYLSPPAREALEGRSEYLWRLILKAAFQRVHRTVCLVASGVCPESNRAIFRSAKDGEWNWIGPYIAERAVPLDRSTQLIINETQFREAKDIGEKFLNHLRMDRRCVVLTGAPNSQLDSPAIAATVAASLNTESILPPSDGLATLDGAHLNPASAERWSGQFLEALTPLLGRCLPRYAK
jgi:hypothetical protein